MLFKNSILSKNSSSFKTVANFLSRPTLLKRLVKILLQISEKYQIFLTTDKIGNNWCSQKQIMT